MCPATTVSGPGCRFRNQDLAGGGKTAREGPVYLNIYGFKVNNFPRSFFNFVITFFNLSFLRRPPTQVLVRHMAVKADPE